MQRHEKYYSNLHKATKLGTYELLTLTGTVIDIKGKENIPNNGTIIAANHQSNADVGSLIYALRPRNLYFIASDSFMGKGTLGLFGKLMSSTGHIVLEKRIRNGLGSRMREIVDHKYDSQIDRILERGLFTIFPEGKRLITGELLSFQKGAAAIAQSHKVPIIPITINGAIDVWPKRSYPSTAKTIEIIASEPIPYNTDNLTSEVKKAIKSNLKSNI